MEAQKYVHLQDAEANQKTAVPLALIYRGAYSTNPNVHSQSSFWFKKINRVRFVLDGEQVVVFDDVNHDCSLLTNNIL